jgi:protein-S-isoprenylcysteine O-methyltransferase Ste14
MSWIKGRQIPRWLGLIGHGIANPLVLVVCPWALSLLATRHGWVGGRPGLWNLAGLASIAAGLSIIVWSLREHFAAAPGGWKLEVTQHYPTPAYLLVNGPYRYSRNPVYLAEAAVWLGWIIFYGSLSILGVFSIMALIAGPFIVPREERGIEARFGEAYLEYKRAVPRWLGKRRR